MRKSLAVAAVLSLVPLAAARADGFDLHEFYGRVKSFAEAAIGPATPRRGDVQVPAAEIDPKMALLPRGNGRLRIIAPPGSPGGDQKLDPR